MSNDFSYNLNPNLSAGTQVVTAVAVLSSLGEVVQPRGAVGIVLRAVAEQADSYRVRFLDGSEDTLRRDQLVIRKHYQLGEMQGQELEEDLYQYIIYRCVVGSRAYGLDLDESDTDRRGIYLPPAHLQWSLYGVPEQLENDATQECYWELQKFITMALKANPNVLECLYSPLVETATPLAEELLALRETFLSKMVYQTYNGYVMSQFKKMEQHIRTHGSIKWKHAMHLIRLLISGITVLKEGTVAVQVGGQREALLAIRRGEVPWEEVDQWRLSLHHEFDAAFTATALPERPNYEKANDFLIKARLSMVAKR